VFSLLLGSGRAIGVKLVAHPAIKAVGFTGSRVAGRNLMRIAADRPEPIPVYAEMSSINPVILRPGALAQRTPEIAAGLSGSLCLGVGQFCTNPGLVFLPEGEAARAFEEAFLAQVRQVAPATMLSRDIARSYKQAVAAKQAQAGVHALFVAEEVEDSQGGPAVFRTDVETFSANPVLGEETFGPSTLLVTYRDDNSLIRALDTMEGQLTGTLHLAGTDGPLTETLLLALQNKVGRLIVNQFPTGVEVCSSMVHGGPFPATSDGRSTSVGTMAIERFCRPVCYQNFPAELLPAALQDANPDGIWRRIDQKLTRDPR
jgi:NADP-dependent aldehyde dehydrogenase